MAIELRSIACVSVKHRSSSSVLILVLVCTLLRINLQPAVAENADNDSDFGSYLEVYPPVNLSQSQLTCTPQPADNKICPLYIALMMSFAIGREYISSGVIGPCSMLSIKLTLIRTYYLAIHFTTLSPTRRYNSY